MKLLSKILFLLTLTLCTSVPLYLVKAAITNSSRVIPYQGRLTDSGGNNVADGTYSMTFKVYTVSTGGSSSFTEAHSSVTVTSGLFSVLLGSLSGSGVNLDFANPPYYLGITIGANAEMSPRIQMGFASLATNSQYLDGTPLSSFVLNTAAIAGAVGTNTRLQATGTGTGSTGSGSIYFLDSSGNTKGRFDTASTSATGGTITTSGGYTIHTFTSSGTFTPNGAGNVEYLVVGGGGAGGSAGSTAAAGGGGGGLRTGTIAVSAQPYSIVVGVGGTSGATSGGNGGDSSFSSITSIGGGGGASYTQQGVNGGSGGGASYDGYIGQGTSGQGNNGGLGSTGTNQPGGGGGGAGSVGGNATSTNGGNGGAGSSSSISGSAVTYAGGGGGGSYNGGTPGSGGSGGGGVGANASKPQAGTPNTGGGGGGVGGTGSGGSWPGGVGGSGIVIVRYPTGSLTVGGYGTMYLGATNTSSADLAEYYVSGDKTLSAGDVVIIDSDRDLGKGVLQKANKPYDSKLVGVISTNPGVILGSIDGDTGKADKRQLALAGRVPVKIDPESEPIEVGDFLTSSDKRGYAKRATESGYVIGKALESWQPKSEYRNPKLETNTNDQNSNDRIEVFINLIYKQEKSEIENLKNIMTKQQEKIEFLQKQINKIMSKWN